MQITTSASEKRTFRTVDDEFISREFSASITRDLPVETPREQQLVAIAEDTAFLRAHVLRCFVLSNMITAEQYANDLRPFDDIIPAIKASIAPSASEPA